MSTLHRIVGVYHAEGSLRGELAYVVGKLLGRAHCALCDITHAGVSEKPEFRTCRGSFVVPIETVHLDERDDAVRRYTEGKTPCVIGLTSEGPVMLLDAAALDRCGASVHRFELALRAALGAQSAVSSPTAYR